MKLFNVFYNIWFNKENTAKWHKIIKNYCNFGIYIILYMIYLNYNIRSIFLHILFSYKYILLLLSHLFEMHLNLFKMLSQLRSPFIIQIRECFDNRNKDIHCTFYLIYYEMIPIAKHSQYIFKHFVFLHLHLNV